MADDKKGGGTPVVEKPADTKPVEKPADTSTAKPADSGQPADAGTTGTKPDDAASKDASTAAQPKGDAKAPVPFALTRPENGPITDADLERYQAHATALGLTEVQTQGLLDRDVEAMTALTASFETDLRADKQLGGDKFDASVAAAVRGMNAALKDSPEDERAQVIGILESSGYGSHKAIVRMFHRIGKMLGEDTVDAGGKSGSGGTPVSTAKKFYGVE